MNEWSEGEKNLWLEKYYLSVHQSLRLSSQKAFSSFFIYYYKK